MPATDQPDHGHPNDKPNDNANEGCGSNDKQLDADRASARAGNDPADESAPGAEDVRIVNVPEGDDRDDDRPSLTRRKRFENLRFNRTLGSVLDTLERAGFAFFIAAWTLLAVYDQLDAPLTSPCVLAVSGPVVMVIAVVLRVWLWERFERSEE